MTNSFEDFLKAKNQNEKPVDWIARKSQWINSVNNLYRNIGIWFLPFISQSLLRTSYREISIYEEYIGRYSINQFDIVIGNDIVSLVPVGTLLLGSYGRIDIRGPKGSLMIVEQQWNEWKFVNSHDKMKRWTVNEESFKAVIEELING
ncbi:hypothetical protein ACFQ3S_05070 [Mucilaginibacter terrae]|uniref:hypothetical protein n=1 Tax=Mucilaginibacter terrae TaxID=1955052 RepID=UPI00363069FC